MSREEIEKEVKEMLDDPRTGLKQSSDTNKTRQAIFAALDEAHNAALKEVTEWMSKYKKDRIKQINNMDYKNSKSLQGRRKEVEKTLDKIEHHLTQMLGDN